MEHYDVTLTDEEYDRLNSAYPKSDGSGLIGRRAEEIVKIYFRRLEAQCKFVDAPPGADLSVMLSEGSAPLSIEIKGTAASDLAWPQLKVSSQRSWELLTTQDIPVYRICSVFGKVPSIYVLRHGRDFVLVPEARWAFKRVAGRRNPVRSHFHPAVPATGQGVKGHGVRPSKYDSLKKFLQEQTAAEVMLRFSDAAGILGFRLPSSAYKHQAYWANQSDSVNRPWVKAWQDAGFEVDAYSLSQENGWVRFRRRVTKP